MDSVESAEPMTLPSILRGDSKFPAAKENIPLGRGIEIWITSSIAINGNQITSIRSVLSHEFANQEISA